ncbi:MAG: protein kinase, partial [Acidobacteriota bacterium]
MNCPKCGRDNPAELVECESCGALLIDIFGTGDQQEGAASPGPVETSGPQPGASTALPEPVEENASLFAAPPAVPQGAGPFTGELPRFSRFGNRYEILELIGEGGMGRVYRARDLELDKTIALKAIRNESGTGPEVVRRFKQELLLARKITHKNVVRIYDLGEANGIKFFTMELIRGKSLKQVLRQQRKLPVEEVLPMARQILSALEEAHAQGVVHRDLKPQNIMVDAEGVPHIMDFGIARSVDGASMTSTASVLGTPDYISPEQVSGESASAQSDLFSFGVILYEMLTGELPFQADTPVARVFMRLTKKPAPPREWNPEIPRYLERIILKCLEVDRVLRYQSAGEALADLDREQVDSSATLRIRRAVARRKTPLRAAALLVLAVGSAAYFTMREPPPQAAETEEPVTTLAILPFTNATGSEDVDWMRAGLPEMLVTDISQSRYVRPVPGERIVKLLRELGVEGQSRFDEATLEAISEKAPAESVLYGQFVESGGRMRLDLALRQAGSGVPTPIKVEEDASQVFALVDRITQQVKEHLDLSPEQLKGDTDRPIAEVSTASLEALRAYQAGLGQLRKGANQAAIPHLQEATSTDPDFAMAYAKLAEAFLHMGQQQEAEAAVESARSVSEAAPLPLAERYQIHAIDAGVREDYETAVKSYEELVKLYPEDPDIQLSLA